MYVCISELYLDDIFLFKTLNRELELSIAFLKAKPFLSFCSYKAAQVGTLSEWSRFSSCVERGALWHLVQQRLGLRHLALLVLLFMPVYQITEGQAACLVCASASCFQVILSRLGAAGAVQTECSANTMEMHGMHFRIRPCVCTWHTQVTRYVGDITVNPSSHFWKSTVLIL